MTIKKCYWDYLFFITGIIGGIMLITGVILTYYFEWGKQTIWPGLAVACASDIGFKLTNRSARNEEKIKNQTVTYYNTVTYRSILYQIKGNNHHSDCIYHFY